MKGEGIRSIYRNNLNQTAFFISPASGAPRQNRPLISKRLHHHFLISFQITFSIFCWLGLGLSLSPFVVDQYNCRVKDPSSAGTPPCSCGSLEPPPYHRESSASREREGSTVQEKSIVRERSAHRRRWGERFKSQGGLSS